MDPDTYVTRMVEEHSVLSGGESAAVSEPGPQRPGWGDPAELGQGILSVLALSLGEAGPTLIRKLVSEQEHLL